MNDTDRVLKDVVVYRSYAKYLPELKRRETFDEIVERNYQMNLKRVLDIAPHWRIPLKTAYELVRNLEIVPSMRSMQFAGEAIERNNARMYNCCYCPIESMHCFREVLFLLLSGCGVGFSVQKRHISKLPIVMKPLDEFFEYFVEDSIEGWSDALDKLIQCYLSEVPVQYPKFNFSKIRKSGELISTTGSKAPGPEPLSKMLEDVRSLFNDSIGSKLTPIKVHDIICSIAKCVLSGGVRRSATISIFDLDDTEMLNAKAGNWYDNHPNRAYANNSGVCFNGKTSKEDFFKIFSACQDSQSGEPGFLWTNDKNGDWGVNPCVEISLEPYQFCNLVSINASTIKNEKDLRRRVIYATMLGTLQATYTNFNYLRDIWRETTERGALVGISFTGISDNASFFTEKRLKNAAEEARCFNKIFASDFKINRADRVTTVKPEGSSSCIMSSSSGIHARHSEYYIRRMRINKIDSLAQYLMKKVPELMEDDVFDSNTTIISIPQKSPEGALTKDNQSAISLLELAMHFNKNWVHEGHNSGLNKNNVSLTVHVKENEWEEVKNFMWKNKNLYTGVSLYPYDDATYIQAPFESISKEKYDELSKYCHLIDLTEIVEETNETQLTSTVACAGGVCEIL